MRQVSTGSFMAEFRCDVTVVPDVPSSAYRRTALPSAVIARRTVPRRSPGYGGRRCVSLGSGPDGEHRSRLCGLIDTPSRSYPCFRVDWGLPYLQDEVCVLCLPPSFPAVPQYLVHSRVAPQSLSEPYKCLSQHTAPRSAIQ